MDATANGVWGTGQGQWAAQMKMRMRMAMVMAMAMAMSLDSGRETRERGGARYLPHGGSQINLSSFAV